MLCAFTPLERAHEASMNRASPVPGALLAFCINQGISASFFLLYLLIGRLQITRFRSIKRPEHPWTVAHQAPLSMGSPRQQYWSGLPFPPPGDLPDQGSNPCLIQVSCIVGRFFTIFQSLEYVKAYFSSNLTNLFVSPSSKTLLGSSLH